MTINREFFIAGVQFREGAKEVLASLEEGELLELELEPTNKFDPNAVAIYYDGTHLGYVPKTMSAEISAAMEVEELLCTVTLLNPVAKPWEMCKVKITSIDESDLPEVEDEDLEDDDYEDDPGELKENEDFAHDNEFERDDEDE